VAAQSRLESAAGGMDYDLSLFVANWPAPRRQPWRTLLRARAIENLAYVIGVNRVGVDGNDLPYAGDSAMIDPVGEPLVELGAGAGGHRDARSCAVAGTSRTFSCLDGCRRLYARSDVIE
jgi:predicted amidohydrolase